MSNAEYNYKPSELGGPTWCIYNENRKSRDVEGEVGTTGFLESTTALILAEILENRSQTARFQNWGFFFCKTISLPSSESVIIRKSFYRTAAYTHLSRLKVCRQSF